MDKGTQHHAIDIGGNTDMEAVRIKGVNDLDQRHIADLNSILKTERRARKASGSSQAELEVAFHNLVTKGEPRFASVFEGAEFLEQETSLGIIQERRGLAQKIRRR